MQSNEYKIVATSQYRLKMLHIHQDILVWLQSGEKQLISPIDDKAFFCKAGELLLIAKGTVWEVINNPATANKYLATVVMFSETHIQQIAENLPEPNSLIHSAQIYSIDGELEDAMNRLSPQRFLTPMGDKIRAHRTTELLLLLAERGMQFESYSQLN